MITELEQQDIQDALCKSFDDEEVTIAEWAVIDGVLHCVACVPWEGYTEFIVNLSDDTIELVEV